jgi:hypothetical protein
MKRMTPFLYMMCAALLMIIVTGCSSSGYSGSTSYYHRNAWDYDNYYRSEANHHYNRPAARANVRSEAGTRAGGGGRSGGGGGGGRR